MPTNTRTIEVSSSGARLAVRDHPGEGTPVVLLHGGPGVPDYLEPVAQMLAPPHRAITFDQRGVGASACLNDRYGMLACPVGLALRPHARGSPQKTG